MKTFDTWEEAEKYRREKRDREDMEYERDQCREAAERSEAEARSARRQAQANAEEHASQLEDLYRREDGTLSIADLVIDNLYSAIAQLEGELAEAEDFIEQHGLMAEYLLDGKPTTAAVPGRHAPGAGQAGRERDAQCQCASLVQCANQAWTAILPHLFKERENIGAVAIVAPEVAFQIARAFLEKAQAEVASLRLAEPARQED